VIGVEAKRENFVGVIARGAKQSRGRELSRELTASGLVLKANAKRSSGSARNDDLAAIAVETGARPVCDKWEPRNCNSI
jgi:hypothetical protein